MSCWLSERGFIVLRAWLDASAKRLTTLQSFTAPTIHMRGGYEADTLWPTATAPQTLTCNRETKRCNRSDLKVVSCTTQQVGQLWSERPHRWRVFFLLENGIYLRLKITFFSRCAGHIWAAPSSGARNTYIDPDPSALQSWHTIKKTEF